ncbi:efflux RND transporter periplasmic adaptor subunit [Oceanimonas marisflavi]|uniref:efflux RND transporter periplasmic adaptor subunit n=1 Tax=Oceanimonas marisflavi TaxID=2059724 RepID=UPI000D32054B|nr:HlyD family efflux transporter periplasmic adaptor subunit [Oceanimonas marisflavi]
MTAMADTNASLTTAPESLLATLLHLGRRARQAGGAAELRFLLVNETISLVPYRQGAFWSHDNGVEALSGVSHLDPQSAYVQWLEHWCKSGSGAAAAAFNTDLRSLPATAVGADWEAWLPPFLAVVSLGKTEHFDGGQLLLARDTPFSAAELALLEEWAAIWTAAYVAARPAKWHLGLKKRLFRRKWTWPVLGLGLAAASFMPVSLTVLAPADLIPLEPAVIRAPMDGVVSRMQVVPNQQVSAGQPLFEFDRVALASRLEVAERTLLTSRAEYRRNAQRALFDADSKGELAILQSQIEEKAAEVNYLRELNRRSEVRSPQDGIVLLDDVSEWTGKPVVTGERVLVVADETRTQIEAWLSSADMIAFSGQAPVTLYLDADPVNPLQARLDYVAHEAELRPEGHYAYRVRASLLPDDQGGQQPRVGLKGTAKLQGERVPLIYWVLRRPWAALRGWIGW